MRNKTANLYIYIYINNTNSFCAHFFFHVAYHVPVFLIPCQVAASICLCLIHVQPLHFLMRIKFWMKLPVIKYKSVFVFVLFISLFLFKCFQIHINNSFMIIGNLVVITYGTYVYQWNVQVYALITFNGDVVGQREVYDIHIIF